MDLCLVLSRITGGKEPFASTSQAWALSAKGQSHPVRHKCNPSRQVHASYTVQWRPLCSHATVSFFPSFAFSALAELDGAAPFLADTEGPVRSLTFILAYVNVLEVIAWVFPGTDRCPRGPVGIAALLCRGQTAGGGSIPRWSASKPQVWWPAERQMAPSKKKKGFFLALIFKFDASSLCLCLWYRLLAMSGWWNL